jgi:hypothetical protein
MLHSQILNPAPIHLSVCLSGACANKYGTMEAIQAMVVNKAKKDSAHQKSYNNQLFDMGHAIARELTCCFFASITAFSIDIPSDIGGHWENWTFHGAIMRHDQVGLGASSAGTRWLLTNDKIQQIEVPDLAKDIPGRLPQLLQVAPRYPCC